MAETDKDLIFLYRNGEADALEKLVEKYRRPLFGFILNMTGKQSEADEIFQEVWLRVIRKISLYKQKNFFGWLVRIAHNIIVDRSRRKKPDFSLDEERRDGVPGGALLPGKGRDPLQDMEASDLGRAIAAAVNQLPSEQKEVLLMRVKAEISFKEIAKIQGVSINTALARLRYALEKLRPMLRENYEDLGR